MTIGDKVRITQTFGSSTNSSDLATRGQLAIIIDDLYARYGTPLYRHLYEVRLQSGSAVGETRLVTLNEMREA